MEPNSIHVLSPGARNGEEGARWTPDYGPIEWWHALLTYLDVKFGSDFWDDDNNQVVRYWTWKE